MSDYGNILYCIQDCQNALKSKDYLRAAISSYWGVKYCEYGEFYDISIESFRKVEEVAFSLYNKTQKKFKSSILSKTTFVYGAICPKLLWLYKNKYDLRRVSTKTQEKFDVGHNIGYLAQKLFPKGVDASAVDSECVIDRTRFSLPFRLKQPLWIARTQMLYKDNTVYEAAFVHDDVFAAVDILEKTESGHIAYEVKFSNSVTGTFLMDCALQYYVINANCKLDDFFLIYVNEEYINEISMPLNEIYERNIDINKLFIIESVLSRILTMQADVARKIKSLKSIINKKEPDIQVGKQCSVPYKCIFWNYCHVDPYDFGIW